MTSFHSILLHLLTQLLTLLIYDFLTFRLTLHLALRVPWDFLPFPIWASRQLRSVTEQLATINGSWAQHVEQLHEKYNQADPKASILAKDVVEILCHTMRF